jgi:AraC-like DNA-binding protein
VHAAVVGIGEQLVDEQAEANQMLESGDASIESIAFEVGYSDASFFNRLFRRKVMMSPARYRRRFGGLKSRLRETGSALR